MEIPSKAAKTRGLKGILYFKTVKDGIIIFINPKKSTLCFQSMPISFIIKFYYIIPIPPPAGIAGASSLIVATADSVVRSVDATEFAF